MIRTEISHHLTDALLMSYAAGTLPEAFSLVVATHVSMCDECRARLGAFEAVGGSMLDNCGSEALSEGALDAVLARISGAPLVAAAPVTRQRSDVPAPLRDYIGDDLAGVRWRPVGMGVRQAILSTGPGAMARLLYIPAGAAVPDHGHKGTELTLVLRGAFLDEGARFGPGDIEVAGQETEHTPVADIGEDCICLAATDAPLRFRGLIPRIAQPFLKI